MTSSIESINKINFNLKPSLVLVGGRSRIGKTTIINALINYKNKIYVRPLSYTTRQKRENESNTEYIFINKNDMYNLLQHGKILTIDEIYGDLYSISCKSLSDIIKQKKIPIKEVHPSNHAKIKRIFPNSISVLMITKESVTNNNKRNIDYKRVKEDEKYYRDLNLSDFDIIFKTDLNIPATILAKNFHYLLYSNLSTSKYFPNKYLIDKMNLKGYSKAASEFNEKKRITTKNFHSLSYSFFLNSVKEFVKPKMKCIEIGPGQGWLKNNVPFPKVDYIGIDISQEMINYNTLESNIHSSVSSIDFKDEYFDIAFASLADPYCYPSALCEIRRVIKSNSLFIFSIPSRQWSDGIREENEKQMTHFVLSDKTIAKVFSFTYTSNELKELLSICGFSVVHSLVAKGINLPLNEKISPAITGSAIQQNINLNDLEILNFVIAKRE